MNRPDILFPCLDSIRAHTGIPFETLVVAYCFTPDNLSLLKGKYPWVSVIESNELRGFSENNNLAIVHARGRYCFILHDDTLMDMPVIDRLAEDFVSLPEDAAAVSPKIVFRDGRVQTCGRAPWSLWRYMKHYLHFVDETKPGLWTMKEGLFKTYTLNGACFLIKTDALWKAGCFDQRFFFTPEDIALGHRLNDLGYSVWTDARVRITHLAGGSVSKMEEAIKPARVKGALLFYGQEKWLRTKFLATFIWCVEAGRLAKHLFKEKVALNVMRSVFSRKSPKQVFQEFTVQES